MYKSPYQICFSAVSFIDFENGGFCFLFWTLGTTRGGSQEAECTSLWEESWQDAPREPAAARDPRSLIAGALRGSRSAEGGAARSRRRAFLPLFSHVFFLAPTAAIAWIGQLRQLVTARARPVARAATMLPRRQRWSVAMTPSPPCRRGTCGTRAAAPGRAAVERRLQY